jgi:phosphoglycolate phosphatase-like HAD superfamily hydrolase
VSLAGARVAVFDLDGTLLDSDAALTAAFLADECRRLGIALDDYLDRYDEAAAQPFAGVGDLVAEVARSGRWAVCSNKHPRSGRAELARLGWEPEVALFSDAFAGPKRLGPVLDALGVGAQEVVFVGDTAHDRVCAQEHGIVFGLAGWNPRAQAGPGDVVLRRPIDVLDLLTSP